METIKIHADTPSGFMIINSEDFDADKHKVYNEKKQEVADEDTAKRGRKPK